MITTPTLTRCLALFVAVPASAGGAYAQLRVLMADRTADALWLLSDNNNDMTITADEVTLFFSAANAAGTPSTLNPNNVGVRRDGLCLAGDQDSTRRQWLWLRDLNDDQDAQDAGESGVYASAASADGFSFAFPVGSDFDVTGRPVLVNASNSFGSDSVFVTRDWNGDGDVNDAGDVNNFCVVNGYGSGSGAHSPQEIVCSTDPGDFTMWVRNSSTGGGHAIYMLKDLDSSGKIDAAAEMTVWFGPGNGDGIATGPGFLLERDLTRPRALYMQQTFTGDVLQIVRAQDLNNDGDAMDAGEAVLAYNVVEADFTPIDMIALPDGSVLISDNASASLRIIHLRDLDNDGTFNGAGERANFFVLAGTGVLQARSMDFYPGGCCIADLVGLGGYPIADGQLTLDDILTFVNAYNESEGCPNANLLPGLSCNQADITGIGGLPAKPDGQLTLDDILAFIDAYNEGC